MSKGKEVVFQTDEVQVLVKHLEGPHKRKLYSAK